ncbi:hypothetical protein ONZ45_g13453 [Pleurotus djamor]|nr:hypothetical protein ONZ45_g13453 [Pleurotus djamor]
MKNISISAAALGVPKPAPSSVWTFLCRELTLATARGKFLSYSGTAMGVVSMPYPIAANGQPVPPASLWRHSQTHSFEMPRCFHDAEVHIQTFSDSSSPLDGHTVAACSAAHRQQCPFFFSITAVLESPSFGRILKYQPSPRIPSFSSHRTRHRSPSPIIILDEPTANLNTNALEGEQGLGTVTNPIFVRDESPEPLPHPLIVRPVLAQHGAHYIEQRAGGGMRSIWELSEGGVPCATFVSMFVQCPGCSNIVIGEYYEDHVCELD